MPHRIENISTLHAGFVYEMGPFKFNLISGGKDGSDVVLTDNPWAWNKVRTNGACIGIMYLFGGLMPPVFISTSLRHALYHCTSRVRDFGINNQNVHTHGILNIILS